MITRRNFIKGSAMMGGLMLLPSWSIGKQKGPNEKLNVALIGVGGIGGQAMDNLRDAPEVRIALFAMLTTIGLPNSTKKCRLSPALSRLPRHARQDG